MLFAKSLVTLGLVASAVAAPTGARGRLAERILRRSTRTSRPIDRIDFASSEDSTSTSSNWAGAVLEAYSQKWAAVGGTFVVPTPKVPSGGSAGTTYAASAWIGIDGDSCQTALWQTGVDFNVQGNSVSYDAWYEWIPAASIDFSGISFKAGDTVELSVVAHSTTTGTATIINQSSGQKVTKTMTGTSSLCLQDAEWIVEDFEENGGLVPLADWGSVAFTNATATTSSGATVGPANADIINLGQNNKILSSTTTSSDSVTVKYTGP